MLDSSVLIAVAQLIGLGSIAGFLAGLLGIGGGSVLVPGLYYILSNFGYSTVGMHTAVGTSLLCIVFTGLSSARAHHQHGAVRLELVKQFVPGVVVGVGLGTLLAHFLSSNSLTLCFALLQISLSVYMLCRSNKIAIFPRLPRQPWFSCIAALNAALATLMGVGGGVQNVLYMTICKVSLANAIGTAAAIGPIIALLGSLGFMYIGTNITTTPPFSSGYIHWPSFVCVISTSIFTAPWGAKLTHTLPRQQLKTLFSVFLLIISFKMVFDILHT